MSIDPRWMLSDEEKQAFTEKLVKELPMLRASVGISQGELAYLIGTTRQTYSAVENGKRPLSWQMYLSLIFIFDNIESSKELITKMEIYPTEIVKRFNDNEDEVVKPKEEEKVSLTYDEIARLLETVKGLK